MFTRLDALRARFDEINILIAQPDVIADQERWRRLMKEQSELAPIIEAYAQYTQLLKHMDEAREMLEFPDMREMAQAELDELGEKKTAAEQELQILMLPKDINDDRNVIVEVRAGAGGDEAGLFGMELVRMYTHYADAHRLTCEVVDENLTELGGLKEVIFTISGKGAYSRFKYESGVHRVQRVPETESQGRIHTSTVTVAIMPQAEEVDVQINPTDLRIDTYRSGGAGGQHVNRTDSAVRITHLPTGIVVQCQNQRSQIQNRERAMQMLRAKLYDKALQEQNSQLSADRKSQVGTGDRSERIRTYNFPQGRVTDHRIGKTIYKLDAFLNGDMDEMIDALTLAERTEKLQHQNQEV
jgi:peptide chain release factor 1